MPSTPSTPGGSAGECPRCHGAGYLRPSEPTIGADGRWDFLTVACDCKRLEVAEGAAARLSTSLGRLAGARWADLAVSERWTPAERQSFEDCRRAALAFAAAPAYALVLAGRTGNGKTTLLACIAADLLARGRVSLFAKVPDLLDRLRESFRPRQDGDPGFDALYEDLKRADVLLLDDLGAESPTPWALEKLYQLVDYRYANALPLAVTTNRQPEALSALSARLYSRLAAYIVVNRTPDHRVPAGW